MTDNGLIVNCVNGIKPLHLQENTYSEKVSYLSFNASIEFELNLKNDLDEVGFFMSGKEYAYICVVRRNGKNYIEEREGSFDTSEKVISSIPYVGDKVIFNIEAYNENTFDLMYRLGFDNNVSKTLRKALAGRWVGSRIGFYARGNNNGGYYYCGFPTLGDSPSLNGGTNFGYLLDVDGDDMQSCGNTGIGGTGNFIYTYDGKNVQIEKTSEYADLSEVDKTPKRTVAINASNYTMFEEYYIYVPETNEGFGPYKNEEVPNFDLEGKGLTEHKQVGDFQTINLGFIHAQPIVQGIFWVHEDGQYRIVTEHGEKSEDLYDEAKVISNDSILVKKGNQVE